MMNNPDTNFGGIKIQGETAGDIGEARQKFMHQLQELGLDLWITTIEKMNTGSQSIHFQLRKDIAQEWMPDGDTTQLCQKLNLDTECSTSDLEREILLSMLAGPEAFDHPSYSELASAVRIRKNIVEAARKTVLAFDTEEAERPSDYWAYSEESGFTILPGKPLITALQAATQPSTSGKLYSFSCYRATEYVILLALAQELQITNPKLHHQLQKQWENRAIKSGEFHDIFMREYGSMTAPLPPKYYVPGDRLWFRNPNELSANIMGYEGSWVFYLGNGLFSNFWKQDQPYTMTAKCLEVFHWRNATYADEAGTFRINETIVEELAHTSMNNQLEIEQILQEMLNFREPQGVYISGGCIDTSREYPRYVCPETCDLILPNSAIQLNIDDR
uniref:Putative lipoprotein n=1 Tax=mine drainage metagenome TaxID=410659 RepID=E6QSJ0_9ZZZZ